MKKSGKKGINLIELILIILVVIILIIVGKGIIQNVSSKGNKDSGNKKTGEKPKFTTEMLADNGIGTNETLETMRKKYSNLVQTNSYVDTKTGNNIDVYSSDNMTLMFKNNNLYTCISTDPNFEFNGIKVGDSKDKVSNAFYKDSKAGDVIGKDGTTIGKYLYGDYTIDDLESKRITTNVAYGYIAEAEQSNDSYDELIEYVYMEPPYSNEYATKKDNITLLEFIIKDNKVTTIATQVAPIE